MGIVREEQVSQRELLEEMNSQLGDALRLRDRIEAMEPHVEDWKRTKQRGIGIIGAAGLGGGAVGVVINKILIILGLMPR